MFIRMDYLWSRFQNFFSLLYSKCSFSSILRRPTYFHDDNSGTDLVFSFAIPSADYHFSSYLSIKPADEENLITKTQGFYCKWYWKFQDSACESELIYNMNVDIWIIQTTLFVYKVLLWWKNFAEINLRYGIFFSKILTFFRKFLV